MKKYHHNLVALIVFLFALACGFLAILWPQWRDELRAQGYYDCFLPIGQHDPQPLPQHFDWKDNLPPVRSQAQCGSCWAFSAVGSVEGTHAVKYNESAIDLSEQNLVSNCGCPGSCYGGWPSEALDYIKNSGIVDENCFPYKSGACIFHIFNIGLCTPSCICFLECSEPCFCNISNECSGSRVRISDFKKVSNDIENIKRALLCYGPLSVASMNWRHAIVLIGYDDDTGNWIIRNSWSTGWGDGGYGHIPYCGHSYSDIVNNVYYVVP